MKSSIDFWWIDRTNCLLETSVKKWDDQAFVHWSQSATESFSLLYAKLVTWHSTDTWSFRNRDILKLRPWESNREPSGEKTMCGAIEFSRRLSPNRHAARTTFLKLYFFILFYFQLTFSFFLMQEIFFSTRAAFVVYWKIDLDDFLKSLRCWWALVEIFQFGRKREKQKEILKRDF